MLAKYSQRYLRFSRAFSSTISSVPGNKPPVREESVAGRYAGILFSLASKNEELHVINEDMTFLNTLIHKSDKVREFVINTSNTKSELQAVLYPLGGSLSDTTKSFIDSLIQGKRVSDLPAISAKFLEYYKMLNKEEGATIISARELTSEQKSRVQQTLEDTYKGTTFTVSYQIDPSILGGLQIYFGNSFMDASLASRVNVIRTEFEKLSM